MLISSSDKLTPIYLHRERTAEEFGGLLPGRSEAWFMEWRQHKQTMAKAPWSCTHTYEHRHPHLHTPQWKGKHTLPGLKFVWSGNPNKVWSVMLGRREKQLQTVINTIGCARRSSLTSLTHWVSANWMWRFLWKPPSVVSSSRRLAGAWWVLRVPV